MCQFDFLYLGSPTGGAHRIESCSYVERGVLTPGPGIIERACELLHIPATVLLRTQQDIFATV